MNKPKLTIKILENASPRSTIFEGTTTDDEDGLNMTGSGRPLRWVLSRGMIADWCVYCHWTYMNSQLVHDYGDKVYERENVENIVDFDDEVWKKYRR